MQDLQWFRRSIMGSLGAFILLICSRNRLHQLLIILLTNKHPIRDQGQASHR